MVVSLEKWTMVDLVVVVRDSEEVTGLKEDEEDDKLDLEEEELVIVGLEEFGVVELEVEELAGDLEEVLMVGLVVVVVTDLDENEGVVAMVMIGLEVGEFVADLEVVMVTNLEVVALTDLVVEVGVTGAVMDVLVDVELSERVINVAREVRSERVARVVGSSRTLSALCATG